MEQRLLDLNNLTPAQAAAAVIELLAMPGTEAALAANGDAVLVLTLSDLVALRTDVYATVPPIDTPRDLRTRIDRLISLMPVPAAAAAQAPPDP